MEIGSAKFSMTFDMAGNQAGGTVLASGRRICFRLSTGHAIERQLSEASIELLLDQGPNYQMGATGMVVGALALGPLGAAAGASAANLMSMCQFAVTFPRGETFVCQTFRKFFNILVAHHRSLQLKAEEAKRIDAVLQNHATGPTDVVTMDEREKSNVITQPIPQRHANVLFVPSKRKQ